MDRGATHGRECASDDAVLFSGSRARSAACEEREATLELPLLLSGPILRRVEATSVSVWVALSVAARVRLSVWDGRVVTGTPNPMIATPAPGVPTLRLGQKLHIALVTLKPPANSQQTLLSGHVYSYDLEIAPTGTTTRHTLASLHMLERGVFGGREQLPLGYEPGFLPSFAPPPADLEHLRIVFGSCRRAAHPDPDAMAYIDDIIALDQAYTDALRRPHQLCLGGDQIYADDVSTQHMLALMPVATELVGVAGTDRRPVEQIRLDAVLQREPRRHPDPGRSADRVSGRRRARLRGRPPAAGRPRALPRGSAPASDAAGGADDEQRRRQPSDLVRRVRRHVPQHVEQRRLGHDGAARRRPGRSRSLEPRPGPGVGGRAARHGRDRAARSRVSRIASPSTCIPTRPS